MFGIPNTKTQLRGPSGSLKKEPPRVSVGGEVVLLLQGEGTAMQRNYRGEGTEEERKQWDAKSGN